MPADSLAAFDQLKGSPAPQTEIVQVTGNPNFDRALQVSVTGSPASAGLDGEYEIALGAGTAAAVTEGDAMVASFWARSIEPTGDAGYATFTFERDGGNYKKSANAALRFTSEWQKFEFPFRMVESYAAGGAHISLWLGYGPQVFQIAGVSVRDYGQGDPAGFPSVTYKGREANAAWRTAANDRISQYRKGDLRVTVVDPAGNPVPDAAVKVSMLQHAFNFGTAADARWLNNDTTDGRKYRSTVAENFNQTALGNDLKWTYWENEAHREQYTLPALEWLRSKDIFVHGHTLVWGSWGYMPPDVSPLANDPAALRARVDGHITDETSTLKGIVPAWDVVNEPYSEHNLTDILGQDEIARWFTLARQGDPDARLLLNEYDLLEKNGWTKRKQDYIYNLLASLKSSGAPIDALGIQGHFTGLQPTPPEDLLPILDRYADLGLPLEITEFDIATDDEQLQADYTRDFLTMMFSYPKIEALSTFGFWESNIWNPLAAFFRADWSAKPNALVWKDLIYRQWWTNAQGQTGADGKYTTRGFLGDYLVTVTVNGVSKQQRVSMPTNTGKAVTVIADGIQTLDRDPIKSLIRNPGFEDGTAGWTTLAAGSASVTDPYSGKRSLRTSGGASGVAQPVLDIKPGTSYTLSGWAKSSGTGNQCYIGVRGGPAPGQASFQHTLNFSDETKYTQKLAAFSLPADTTWTQAFVWHNGGVPGNPVCTVDDVTLTETVGTAPPSPAPPFITPKLPGNASMLLNGDVERGSTTGWYCLGPCTLSLTGSPTHGGSGALAATARGETWAGAAQGVSVGNGGVYNSSAWVRLKNPGTDTAQVALKVVSSTGTTTIPLGSATVTDTGWTQIAANNVPISFSGSFQQAEWWISTRGSTTAPDLLIDDASFSVRSAPPAGMDFLLNGDVENGKNNWYCFSPCVASAVSSPVHSGAGALKATGRTYEWAGPAEGVEVTNGAKYKTSAWVRLASGAADTTALVKIKLTKTDGTSETVPLASAPVNAAGWTQVHANNVTVSWTGTLAKAEWWVSTTSGADDFYVDDAALQPAGEDQTALGAVVPTAPCVVSNYNGTYTAYFGYDNPNAFGVPIPVGTGNLMTPSPGDRGQPVSFLPFQRPKRAGVPVSSSSNVTWQVNGTSQTATASSPRCTP
ncbi:endo-1,4-beta-xylanase [Actinopolymorpha alba]|uniref:endo-1,4-beta-xylanase n=1 Tax=Actinopolymorpha alba TaxID=533267 RepID=UPI0003818BDF|nr:endo-1,4-beta-xylanase [Actinopolymorpha alba]